MSRTAYLASPDVAAFVDWLVTHLYDQTLFKHSYIDRRTKQNVAFRDLADALKKYRWQHGAYQHAPAGDTLLSSHAVLTALQKSLLSSIDAGNDSLTAAAAIEVMRWGGVLPGNRRWLLANTPGLAKVIAATAADLRSGSFPASTPTLTSMNLRFNAGMTKVHALLVDDLIIYDSRVAAGLGWIVTRYCLDQKLSNVPSELQFPWAPAKEAPGSTSPKSRNPSQGGLQFPRLMAGPHHAEWNLKASWVLNEVLRAAGQTHTSKSVFTYSGSATAPNPVKPLRRLEAALFMIGYDLSGVHPAATHKPSPQDHDSQLWTECFTTVKRNRFLYRIDDTGINVLDHRKLRFFPIELVNDLLELLFKRHVASPFPLANSATKVRAGTATPGMGTAFLDATNGKGNPPDCSALAAVLEDVGIFIPSAKPKGWSLRVGAPQLHRTGTVFEPGAESGT